MADTTKLVEILRKMRGMCTAPEAHAVLDEALFEAGRLEGPRATLETLSPGMRVRPATDAPVMPYNGDPSGRRTSDIFTAPKMCKGGQNIPTHGCLSERPPAPGGSGGPAVKAAPQ